MFIDFFLRMVKLASKYQFVKIFSKMLLKLLLKEKKSENKNAQKPFIYRHFRAFYSKFWQG